MNRNAPPARLTLSSAGGGWATGLFSCAKQSQFSGGPRSSYWLAGKGVMTVLSGPADVKNKANFRRARGRPWELLSRPRPSGFWLSPGLVVQTKPIGWRLGRLSVRNKPNLGMTQIKRNRWSENELGGNHADSACAKTKPIVLARSLRADLIVQNKANFEAWPVQPNKANSDHFADLEIGVPGGHACGTKPISSRTIKNGEGYRPYYHQHR